MDDIMNNKENEEERKNGRWKEKERDESLKEKWQQEIRAKKYKRMIITSSCFPPLFSWSLSFHSLLCHHPHPHHYHHLPLIEVGRTSVKSGLVVKRPTLERMVHFVHS